MDFCEALFSTFDPLSHIYTKEKIAAKNRSCERALESATKIARENWAHSMPKNRRQYSFPKTTL